MNWAFSSLSEFLEMGKHGHFVWICVWLTIAALILLFVIEITQHRFLQRAMAQQPGKRPPSSAAHSADHHDNKDKV